MYAVQRRITTAKALSVLAAAITALLLITQPAAADTPSVATTATSTAADSMIWD
ncbi:hypothetical protein [Streptomyces sp. YGL11-2]|uniref:hypothetical protein n=1 Tax=Streptomyces sp. YGL11-2 TaxID=3414028 RepID=UPI003CF9FC5E